MKNKKLAIRLINADCKIRRRYRDKAGNTCAIGCLAKSAGASLPQFRHHNNGERIGANAIILLRMVEAIELKFELGLNELMEIQSRNDDNTSPAERRKAIIAYLKKL